MEGLTVIVPCFNEKGSLKNLLTEISFQLEKSLFPWEVIIIDDASTDGSLDDVSADGNKFKVI